MVLENPEERSLSTNRSVFTSHFLTHATKLLESVAMDNTIASTVLFQQVCWLYRRPPFNHSMKSKAQQNRIIATLCMALQTAVIFFLLLFILAQP